MKNKYLKITVVLLLFCGISSAQMPISKEQYYKLNQTVYAIKELYVDTVNDTKLVEYAISGILENLDPHSVYIPAQEVQRANEPLQGSFDGIGIQFQMQKDTLLVVNPLRNCPAEKVGVLMGDRIISVDGVNIAGVKMQTSDIMKKLRGRRGTKVNVQVVRRGVKEPIDFVITRDKTSLLGRSSLRDSSPSRIYQYQQFLGNYDKRVRKSFRRAEKERDNLAHNRPAKQRRRAYGCGYQYCR